MDTYSKIVKFSILLILLFIFATNSYALCPDTLVRTALLLLGSVSLIFSAYTYNKDKAYLKLASLPVFVRYHGLFTFSKS